MGFIDALGELGDTPVPTILVIAGVAFLFVAIGGQLGAKLTTGTIQKLPAAALGGLLLLSGLGLYFVSASPDSPSSDSLNGSEVESVAAETQAEVDRLTADAQAEAARVIGAARAEADRLAELERVADETRRLALLTTVGPRGLMWTVNDNGANITWPNARRYCEDYLLSVYDDWRLPTVAELRRLYDDDVSYTPRDDQTAVVHITQPIILTNYGVWSSERGLGFGRDFYFTDNTRGDRGAADRDEGAVGGQRALCVREP